MTILAIASTAWRRVLRDRIGLFFLIVLPIIIIVILGVTFGGTGSHFRVGVVNEGAGPLGDQLVSDLKASSTLEVRAFHDVASVRVALRRGELDAALVLPAGLDRDLRNGRRVQLDLLGERATTSEQAARTAISAVVDHHAARLLAAQFATGHAGGTLEANLARADQVEATTTPVTVRTDLVDTKSRFLPRGFGYSTPTMLVLFVFINSLAGGAVLIETRRLGLYARMMAAPTSSSRIVAGETLCYLGLALLQSLLIVGVGGLVFGVDWGPPVASGILVVTWALVGTGAGMLSGTLFHTGEQATAIGPPIGIAFGMLGGCMWPLEIVGPVMRTIGHFVPHAWAIDAWVTLLSKGGGLSDIGPDLAVLAGFAAVLLGLATVRLRQSLIA